LHDEFFPGEISDDGDVVDAPAGAVVGDFLLPLLEAAAIEAEGGAIQGNFGVLPGFYVQQFYVAGQRRVYFVYA
jgi:hypothetical protein